MNNNLQLVLKSSTTEMSLNDHDAGIYIVPELDGLTGLPEIRTTSGVNAGYDGGWTSAQKFDARSIVIRGVIANEDKTEVERMRRELVALLAQGKNEQLELDFVTETGRAYEVQVRTIACDMAMQRVLTQQEFMITLRADDPLIYDNSSAGEEATVNVSGATGGFRIPFEIPLAIDAGSEETVVQNSGLESVAPTIKMYGALHNPKIINHTTNQAMQVEAELGFTEGAWTTPVDAPEGTNVSFEPEREAPIESAKLKGNTSQQTYSGKNLLNLNFANGSNHGISFTNNGDGTITASGTTTGQVAYGLSPASVNNLVLQNGKTYTQRVEVISGNLNLRVVPSFKNSGGTITYNYFRNNQSRTTTDTMTCNAYDIYASTTDLPVGSSVNFTIRVWLEEGSDLSSPYEPYVGGIPAPNPDYPQAVQTVTGENVVKICGKNLFDGETINAWLRPNGTEVNSNGDRTSANYIAVLPNTTYTLHGTLSTYLKFTQFDSSKTAVSQQTTASDTTLTVTTGATTAYIRIGWGNAANASDVMLELGSTATTYEPYQGQSYPISLGTLELCKIGDYQDYIYKDGSDWKIHKATQKIVYNGSETWNTWNNKNSCIGFYHVDLTLAVIGAEARINGALFCDKFSETALRTDIVDGNVEAMKQCGGAGNQYIAIGVELSRLSDTSTSANAIASFKTWLSSNTPTLYGVLATPTDTEITNEALIEQLEALVDGNAVVYEGETNIAITAAEGNLPGIAAIRYYTDKEPDQRDELVIDSRLKTITLNGLDVYHLQAPGSEFLMLAPGENKLSLQSDITGDNGYAKVSYKQGYLSI